ncbi:LysR family transcriptional regulator [Shewanella avicenniae]|uniref:LysR family transcriptional regulator n=1 Tax=Shewanella avicenniae TaxID=2814294 RepID=A0ABX7QQP8_9GAMM|nr:LysR substrate-binding domain-containing protein [Shewanella avicenniae]QSX33604.1 LysR family transcriptional regulator [Shewanella avicenniae]
MELRHLRYFITIADTGSFTEAANRLYTVQPSLSRQIKDLESYVGTPLLVRGHRQVSLTEAGKVFLDESRLVLAQCERAVERARQVAKGAAAQFVAGFDYGLEHKYLARVSSIVQQASQVDLVVRSLPAPTLLDEVLAGKIDVAFVPPRPDMYGFNFRILGHSPLIAAMHRDHPLAQQAQLSATELINQPIVSATAEFGPALHQASVEFGHRNGVNLTLSHQAETLTMAISLVQSVKHVALLPYYSRHLFPSNIITVELAGNVPQVPYAMVWQANNHCEAINTMLQQFAAE